MEGFLKESFGFFLMLYGAMIVAYQEVKRIDLQARTAKHAKNSAGRTTVGDAETDGEQPA